MADNTDRKLIERLESKHPRYEEKSFEWQEVEDVLYNKVNSKKTQYLPKSAHEKQELYEFRVRMARFKPETPQQIQKVVSAVFERQVTRPKKILDQFADIIENADGCGTSLNEFMQDRLFNAMGFGADFVLIDKDPTEEDGVTSFDTTSKGFVETQDYLPEDVSRIRLIPYRIWQLVDWDLDRRGEFNWIRLSDKVYRKTSPDAPPQEITVYTEWDRTSWRRFEVLEGKKKSIVGYSEGNHNLGMVPVATLWVRREGPMKFLSPAKAAVDYDIQNFIDDADLRYDTYMHAHPTLKRRMSNEQAAEMVIGGTSVVDLNPSTNEDIEYLSYPTAATEQLRKNIAENQAGLRRAIGMDPLGQNDSNQAFRASGRARALSYSNTESKQLAKLSMRLQDFERRVFEICNRWEIREEDVHPAERTIKDTAAWNRDFTKVATETLIDNFEMSKPLVMSEEYSKEVAKKIVDSMLPDISPELRSKIFKQIEESDMSVEDVPMELDPEFGPGDESQDAAINESENLKSQDEKDPDRGSKDESPRASKN